jgi:aminoglycoside phosphotransferase (APT) family kinase protein
MQISRTEKYLSLVLGSLENTLVPNLASHDAKATAGIMKAVLLDLMKREHYTPRLLAEHLAEGRALAQRIAASVDEFGADEPNAASPALLSAADAAAGFDALAERHRDLTERIADLANRLVILRSKASDATRQRQISTLLHEAARWEYAYYAGQRDAAIPPAPAPAGYKGGAPLDRCTLQAFLRTQHPDGERCEVESFESIPGGFGKQTFRVVVKTAAGHRQALIVRKSDPTPMVVYGGFLIEHEFHLLKDLFASGMPVAEPLYLGVDVEGVDADFYVMTTLPGKVAGAFLDAASAVIPESVILHMAELLARLHKLPLAAYAGYLARFGPPGASTETIGSCYRRSIGEWRTYYENGDHLPSPFVTYMLDWLEQHVPADARSPVLVHGDFNIHNVLTADGRVTGVLDWECAMFGAPEQDLAYMKPIISKHIEWDRFLGHYRGCGGSAIDAEAMGFYMAFSAMRLNIVFNKGTRNLQQGITRDIRYALVETALATEFMKLALASTSIGI